MIATTPPPVLTELGRDLAEELRDLAAIGRAALRAEAVSIVVEGVAPVVAPASDAEAAAWAPARPLRPDETRIEVVGDRCAILAPFGGGRPLGVCAAFRPATDPFGPQDVAAAERLATQAGRIAARIDALDRVTRLMHALAVLETESPTEAPAGSFEDNLVRLTRTGLGFRGAALYRRSREGGGMHLTVRDGEVPERLPGILLPGTAAMGAEPVEDLALRWGRSVDGRLLFFSPGGGGPELGPAVRTLLAARLAASLGASGLIDSERRQREMAEALQEASQAIDRELELTEVLDRILEQVMRAFACDAANFAGYDGRSARVIRARGYERFGLTDADMMEVTFDPDVFTNLGRMARGEAVAISDTALDPDWVSAPRFEWLRSWAGVPVRYGETILGFVMLDSSTPGTFDESSTRRLTAFAAHAGAAMHNARLYSRLVREHTRLEQVHTIGRRFSGSLNPDEILEKLGIATLEALGGDAWAVFLPRRSRSGQYDAWPRSAFGARPSAADLPDPDWIRAVAESYAPDIAVVDRPAGRFTLLAFPLTSGDRTHGVGVVAVRGEVTEPESWLDVLRPVGQQAGLALASAEEHAVVQRRLAELTAVQTIVRHIAGRLEVDSVLRELARQLHSDLGFPVVQIYMRQGDQFVLRQHSGPGTMIGRVRLDQGIVGRAARLGRPELVEDVRADPDYIAGLAGTRAEAAVPILAEGRVIGVLNIETADPDQLDRDALDLLTLLADQLSIALQNASLYEAAQTNLEALEARVRERTAQLEAVLEQAVAAERVKAQFVADVSHELRTPLTNIGLYLDLLDLSTDDRRAGYMATLRRETERLGRLIEQLLAMSHLDTGQAELRLVPTDLNALVKVLVGDRSRLVARKGITLELLPEPSLPLARADPQYLMQVMTNLLSNAVSYTPAGGRIVLATGRAMWDDRAFITMTVRDTGPGIPEEEQPHIFERFYRGVHARTSGVAGTGLGLAISRDIMTRHGGRLTVDSRPGQGSAFTLWLPLTPAPPTPAAEVQPEPT